MNQLGESRSVRLRPLLEAPPQLLLHVCLLLFLVPRPLQENAETTAQLISRNKPIIITDVEPLAPGQ